VSNNSDRFSSFHSETYVSNGPKIFRTRPKVHPLADERVARRMRIHFMTDAVTLAYVIKNKIVHS
jgi:hypothetical protein